MSFIYHNAEWSHLSSSRYLLLQDNLTHARIFCGDETQERKKGIVILLLNITSTIYVLKPIVEGKAIRMNSCT